MPAVRPISSTVLVFVFAIVASVLVPAIPVAAETEPLCFEVAGISACIEGRFRQFWERNGGLPIFGLPLTPAAHLDSGNGIFVTQYFERARLEYHPEHAPPFDVQLGRLGDDWLNQQGLDWYTFPRAEPGAPHYFEASGHAIAHEPFWQYWQSHGLTVDGTDAALDQFGRSLALFGQPISEPWLAVDSNGNQVLTQWFERARFEDHGEQGVLLGLLGNDLRPAEPHVPAPVPPPLPEPAPPPPGPPPAGDKVIYLTFDDGPWHDSTLQIVALLAQYNARATFFVIGRQVGAHPGVIAEAARLGNTFGNHTYNHARLTGLGREGFQHEVLATQSALGPYAVPCLRPPYGLIDANVSAYAGELGYQIVMWDVDTLDWQRPGAGVIADRVLQQAAPGKVVLLHDGGGDRSQTVAALGTILSTLSAQGYRFEPIC